MKTRLYACIINPRTIFLIILVGVLLGRFGTKMIKGYSAWDFFPTYCASQNILEKGDIYGDTGISTAKYTRSPVFALFLRPIGLMPRNVASFIWCLLSIFSLAAIFIICEKLFVSAYSRNFYWIFACPFSLLFLSRPLMGEFLLGQVDMIILALIMGALLLKNSNKDILCALFLVTAISIKLTPLIFLLYFALKREFRLTMWAILFMVVFLMLPAVFVSWKQNSILLSSWFHSLNYFYPHEGTVVNDGWFQSLYFFFRRFLFSDKFNLSLFHAPSVWAKYLNYLSFFTVLFFTVRKPRNQAGSLKPLLAIDYAILVISMTIFSPLAADYTYVNLVVPILLVVYLFKDKKLYRKPLFVMLGAIFLIFNYFTSTKAFRQVGIQHIKGEGYCYLVVMTVVWQALVLLCLLFLLKYSISADNRTISR